MGGWFRDCATSRKAVVSIPEGGNLIFHRIAPSGRTVALESNQSLTKISTMYLLVGEVGRCLGLTILSPLCADYLEILRTSASWKPKGLSRTLQGLH